MVDRFAHWNKKQTVGLFATCIGEMIEGQPPHIVLNQPPNAESIAILTADNKVVRISANVFCDNGNPLSALYYPPYSFLRRTYYDYTLMFCDRKREGKPQIIPSAFYNNGSTRCGELVHKNASTHKPLVISDSYLWDGTTQVRIRYSSESGRAILLDDTEQGKYDFFHILERIEYKGGLTHRHDLDLSSEAANTIKDYRVADNQHYVESRSILFFRLKNDNYYGSYLDEFCYYGYNIESKQLTKCSLDDYYVGSPHGGAYGYSVNPRGSVSRLGYNLLFRGSEVKIGDVIYLFPESVALMLETDDPESECIGMLSSAQINTLTNQVVYDILPAPSKVTLFGNDCFNHKGYIEQRVEPFLASDGNYYVGIKWHNMEWSSREGYSAPVRRSEYYSGLFRITPNSSTGEFPHHTLVHVFSEWIYESVFYSVYHSSTILNTMKSDFFSNSGNPLNLSAVGTGMHVLGDITVIWGVTYSVYDVDGNPLAGMMRKEGSGKWKTAVKANFGWAYSPAKNVKIVDDRYIYFEKTTFMEACTESQMIIPVDPEDKIRRPSWPVYDVLTDTWDFVADFDDDPEHGLDHMISDKPQYQWRGGDYIEV